MACFLNAFSSLMENLTNNPEEETVSFRTQKKSTNN